MGTPRVCNMCQSVYYMLSVDMGSISMGSVVGSVSSMGSVVGSVSCMGSVVGVGW